MEYLIILGVLVIVGVVGYFAYKNNEKKIQHEIDKAKEEVKKKIDKL